MLTAAPISIGAWSGRVQIRARSTVTSPSWLTSSPASSRADDVDALAQPGVRTSLRGHPSPVMCSLEASPVPSATQKRPGTSPPASPQPGRRSPGGTADPERSPRRTQVVRGQRRTQPRPGETRVPLPLAPRGEVVRAHRRGEPGVLRGDDRCDEHGGWTCSWDAWNPMTVTWTPYPTGPEPIRVGGHFRRWTAETSPAGGRGQGVWSPAWIALVRVALASSPSSDQTIAPPSPLVADVERLLQHDQRSRRRSRRWCRRTARRARAPGPGDTVNPCAASVAKHLVVLVPSLPRRRAPARPRAGRGRRRRR